MKKVLILLTTMLILPACSSKKIHSIAELTTRLSVNSNEIVDLSDIKATHVPSLPWSDYKNNTYQLTKYNIISQPVTINNTVYVIDSNGAVIAFSVDRKEVLWTRNIFNKQQGCTNKGGGILYNQGKLYITNGSRYVVVLDANNGHELLRKEFSDVIKTTPIIIKPNKLLIQTFSNQLVVFDINSSKTNIIHEGYVENVQPSYNMTPIKYNSTIIASYNSERIFALDYNKDETTWVINLNELLDKDIIKVPGFDAFSVACAPLMVQNSLYVATTFGQILKINPATGKVIWKSDVSDVQSMSNIGNNIFITTNANQIAALNLSNGKIKWAADLEAVNKKSSNIFYSEPIVTISEEGVKFITVFNNHGHSYNFALNNNQLSTCPDIIPVPKNIAYLESSACLNEVLLITNNKIIFVRK